MNIKNIIATKTGEQAVMAIYELLLPIFSKNKDLLSHEEQVFCYIEELESEVNSGGFDSYFSNDYGDYAEETLNALEEVGSVEFKGILKEAMAVFGEVYFSLLDEREHLIEVNEDDYEAVWEDLEERFYQYNEDIHQLLIDFVNKNIDSFR